VWVATSDDVPVLRLKKYFRRLIEKLKLIIPELLDANGFNEE
jgi:hypothetical protein